VTGGLPTDRVGAAVGVGVGVGVAVAVGVGVGVGLDDEQDESLTVYDSLKLRSLGI
jgi:hypothetical protein